MTASSQFPHNNRHGQPIQPIRPQSQQTYLPQYNNNAPHLPQFSNGSAQGYNLNDTPVFQRPQPGPQQPSSIQVSSVTENSFSVFEEISKFIKLFRPVIHQRLIIFYCRDTAIMVSHQ